MKTEELSLYSLKYFFDVVESGSLTKAADLNHVTRSAISQSIHRLEQWAEKKLTTHAKKNFQLTPEGEAFYRHMKASFQVFKNTVEASPNSKGSIKIGCSASLAESFLIPIIKKLGDIKSFHLITGTSSRLSYLLSEEEVHIALSVKSGPKSSMEGNAISSGNFILVSKDGKMRGQVITTEPRPEVTALKRHCLHEKKEEISFLTVESWSLALKLAIELDCACLIPDFMLNPKIKKIQTRGFSQTYKIVLDSLCKEKLSGLELRLVDLF